MGNKHPKLLRTQTNLSHRTFSKRTLLGGQKIVDDEDDGKHTAPHTVNKATNDNCHNQAPLPSSGVNKNRTTTDYLHLVSVKNCSHSFGDNKNENCEKKIMGIEESSVVQNASPGLVFDAPTHYHEWNNLSTNVVTEKTTVKVPTSPRYQQCLADGQKSYNFALAVGTQNDVATAAIQSLGALSQQIVEHIASIKHPDWKDGGINVSSECIQTALVLIRRLLLDAQTRFWKMVEDNKHLASHIDTAIQKANQEVSMLRAELSSTSSRLKLQGAVGRVDKGTQIDKYFISTAQRSQDATSKEVDELKITIQTLTKGNKQLVEDYKHLLEDHDKLKIAHETLKRSNDGLKAEVSKLEGQLHRADKDCGELAQSETASALTKCNYGEIKLELIQARQELTRAKEVLQGMKSDRKRLKGEKLDLLSQMKQLYATLEEKEVELRDFIMNYEQRVKESDEMIKQFAKEKESVEREKWDVITKAKDAAERAMFLKAQLDTREQNIRDLEAELKEVKEQLDSSNSTSYSCSTVAANDLNIIHDDDEDDEVFPAIAGNGFSTMEESSVLNCIFHQSQDNSGHAFSCSPNITTDSLDASGPMFKWFTQSSDLELPLEPKPSKKKKNFGSLSRVFSRSRMRRSIIVSHTESVLVEDSCQKLCLLNQDNYQEKLSTIEKMVSVDMKEWRAPQVLAWLEITLAMPMYAQNCLNNVKSGKVLLGLSDSELSAALGVINPMHRRKLRLAIEQHRSPNEIKYIKASEMDPTWIAHRFLLDLGLPQYTDVFEEQLCDGHILNTLTRRDLEKHFSVHRKFHQSSILHAVELLRRIDFNKERLYQRRNQCDNKDIDLIVWTNERLIKWIRSIDLGEFSESLVESGVHGAVIVLEPTFNADTLASILGIAPSKSYLRRHLAAELDIVLKPARTGLDASESKERGSDSSTASTSSQDKDHLVYDDSDQRRSEEEGRALLAEILGRKYESTSS